MNFYFGQPRTRKNNLCLNNERWEKAMFECMTNYLNQMPQRQTDLWRACSPKENVQKGRIFLSKVSYLSEKQGAYWTDWKSVTAFYILETSKPLLWFFDRNASKQGVRPVVYCGCIIFNDMLFSFLQRKLCVYQKLQSCFRDSFSQYRKYQELSCLTEMQRLVQCFRKIRPLCWNWSWAFSRRTALILTKSLKTFHTLSEILYYIT